MLELRYCSECERETRHYISADAEPGERIFFGILTLGISEAMIEHIRECNVCGHREID